MPQDAPIFTPQGFSGLAEQEAQQKLAQNGHNAPPKKLTRSVPMIFAHNIFTLFNLINVVLAVLIIGAGELKNAGFVMVAVLNTAMGIIQELRAKSTLDKLSILAQSPAKVLRDGAVHEIPQEGIVLDDVLYYQSGDQICSDGTILQDEGLEVDESLLTGEADSLHKHAGEPVMSGSFITAGRAYVRVTAVGEDNYATKIVQEARQDRRRNSQLLDTINRIIRVLTFVIVPLGVLQFLRQYNDGHALNDAILGASGAMIGMIPEGLVLLTGVTLTLGALTLARKKALVQSLPSIETLARVDVLCLDKTGTITDGTLRFECFAALDGLDEAQATEALCNMMAALPDTNATATALRGTFSARTDWQLREAIPFSSQRKWSAVNFDGHRNYAMGAPSFLLPGFASMPQARTAHQYAEQGFRVLCLVSSDSPISAEQLPGDLKYAGLIVLGDTIREEARDTFAFFAREGVQLKVISGDEALTVSVIAGRAGLDGSDRYIDMSAVPEGTDLREIAEQYTVFGRVSPHAKRELIRALQSNGHTACMTGDGVNDVLALKEAACGVAMIGGSDAARRASDFVLMTSDFSAMIHVLQEGRRVINNIQRVSAMYLVKTMYSTLLSLLYLFLPFVYPFTPIALMPINTLCVGIPTFFLALRPNYNPPEQRFLVYVLRHSLPAALSIVAHILLIQYAGARLGMTSVDIQLCFVMMTGVVCFTLLWQAARPHLWWTRAMIAVLVAAFIASVGCFYWFIEIGSPLNPMNARLYLPLCVSASVLYLLLQQGVIWIDQKWSQWSARKKISKSA